MFCPESKKNCDGILRLINKNRPIGGIVHIWRGKVVVKSPVSGFCIPLLFRITKWLREQRSQLMEVTFPEGIICEAIA